VLVQIPSGRIRKLGRFPIPADRGARPEVSRPERDSSAPFGADHTGPVSDGARGVSFTGIGPVGVQPHTLGANVLSSLHLGHQARLPLPVGDHPDVERREVGRFFRSSVPSGVDRDDAFRRGGGHGHHPDSDPSWRTNSTSASNDPRAPCATTLVATQLVASAT
jgi:hypothetical protein